MLPFAFYPRRFVSHFLILICIGISFVGFMFPAFQYMFGFHVSFYRAGDIVSAFAQMITFQFLHGDILHLFMNSYFLYSAGPEVEGRMSRSRFIAFFLSSTLFTALGLYFFAGANSLTIGISGFCMALLSYLWLDLSRIRHPMANQILIMLVINIALGLSPGISFVGHAAGAVWGIVWWQLRKY